MKQLNSTRQQCGAACDVSDKCQGFLYILPGAKRFPYAPCYLKTRMCEKPRGLAGLDISAYFKIIPEGKSL